MAQNHPNRSKWQYKVVKYQRGTQGQWFAYPAAATFAKESDAKEYAAKFAKEQTAAGVVGTRINVMSRRKIAGPFGPTHNVAEYRV